MRMRLTPTFRSSLDVIPVDVQVIDRTGAPVTGLGPDKFIVTINGRRRRVLSAELIDSRGAASMSAVERAAADVPSVATEPAASSEKPSPPPRRGVIAVGTRP